MHIETSVVVITKIVTVDVPCDFSMCQGLEQVLYVFHIILKTALRGKYHYYLTLQLRKLTYAKRLQ